MVEKNIESETMNNIYKLAIEEPHLSVQDILSRLNVKASVYVGLSKNHLSISKYRKAALGFSKTVSEDQKKILLNNLSKSPFRNKIKN